MMDSSFGGQRLCNIRSNTSISNHLPLNPLKTDANAFYGKIIPIAYTTYENQTWHSSSTMPEARFWIQLY